MKYTIIITSVAILLATLTHSREPVERANSPKHLCNYVTDNSLCNGVTGGK